MDFGTEKKASDHSSKEAGTGVNWIKIADYGIFAVLLAGVSAITFWLFFRQCVESMAGSGIYISDMKAYILKMQGLDSGYSFPYPVFFKLSAFFHLWVGPECAVALATMFLNSLGIVLTKYFLNRLAGEPGKISTGVLVSAVSISLFFISMLYPPAGIYLPGIHSNYLGVFTANPFHNATYMAARPFTILAFIWYVKLLDGYEGIGSNAGKVTPADYILFSVFLLAATMTKPSFTIVLVGAAGLIMLYRLFRAKFANLKETILLGLAFLPTFADLLYQFNGVFVPEEGAEGGVGFCFGSIWALYCDNLPLAIGLAMGFPILVLLLNYKELKSNTLYRFSWQVYLMGFAMAFFLYEKGFRESHFNFAWGYMYGIFFAFFSSVLVLLRATAAKKKPVLLALQWLAFGLHLVCGVFYFYSLCQGKKFC